MYVLTHKNRVLAGPMDWNRAIFDGNLEKLKIMVTLPRVAPEELPLVIDADTVIYSVEFNEPVYNKKINYLEGPYWTYENDRAIAGYLVKDQPVESVRANLKLQAADVRWSKETAGTTVDIQGITVTVDTARGSRDIFVQKYLLMADADVVSWKFPEAWLTLTKSDLGAVVAAGAGHVQSSFAWEKQISDAIDLANTLTELDAIVIVEPVTPQLNNGLLAD